MNETFILIFWLIAASTAFVVTYKIRSDPASIFAMLASIIMLAIPVIFKELNIFPLPIIIISLILQWIIIMIFGAGILYHFTKEPIESAFMLCFLVIAIHLVYTNTLIISDMASLPTLERVLKQCANFID